MAKFDPTIPSIARVYDYWLGGKDNFAADRELADQMLVAAPTIRAQVLENRQFLSRAVTWAARQGIGQFIDLGCGMPTVPNTHESVRAVIGDARVVYVDNDPVVLNHLHALFAKGNPGVSVVDGDVRDVAAILDVVSAGLRLSEPACLVAGALLHFFTAGEARDLMAKYTAVLAPGSYVAVSAMHVADTQADVGRSPYSSRAARLYNHSLPDIASFFGPLDLVPPGIVHARRWHPDAELQDPSRTDYMVAALARKQ